MGANNHKVVNAINVIQSLPDRVVGSAQTLKAMFDNVGEIVRLKHNDLCDYIDADIATKAEVQGVTLGQITDGTITKVKLAAALQTEMSRYRPVGSVITMATTTVPDGYLECDGSPVSRVTYSDLFSAIGTAFGVGDGSSTFNLPDLRGEFIRGWDHGRGVDTGRTLGTAQEGTRIGNQVAILNGEPPTDVITGYNGGSSNTTTRYTVRPRNIALMYCIKY